VQFDSSKIYEENGKEYCNRLKEELLSKVSNSQIIKYYIPGEGDRYKVLCPFHKENSPSFSIDLIRGVCKCFGCGRGFGDGIAYVQAKYNLTFYETLITINNDFGLLIPSKSYTIPSEVAIGLPKKEFKNVSTEIKIKVREWLQKDILYWKQFGISKELCIEYNIYPISHYWINQYMFSVKLGDLAYAFLEGTKFQIYQPYANKDKKWFSNTGAMVYGYDQLPPFGKLLFITSSKKDILTLKSLGYYAVASNNEGTMLPRDKYEDLNNRFDRIVLFFNNDPQGLKAAHMMAEELGLDFIFIPFEYNETDPSDYHKSFGEDKTDELIKQLLNESCCTL